ncbi:phenylacetate-CoA oxygenase subunit PaaJ [Bacillus infantis]|uniref:1,2-phenylacetyl-CoA epoxidase subunit PaaD n=1 Tax=Bacillus infantis TaxID=324767 RepID=UPI001CD76AE5|nr:1,2-phenylacetyl-CoA epoxidase subunit PaaD [Bacillus infantis]MCA1037969.1 phenylacetate-CoA oxygenase subunit PaaJ [Bacillus infantis]
MDKARSEIELSILGALDLVKDPEIPAVSIIELGMVEKVQAEKERIVIDLLPTFLGCPALEMIQRSVEEKLGDLKLEQSLEVRFIYDPPWTSDRISEKGKRHLKEFGISPAPERMEETGEWKVDCPYCGSPYTTLENIFGPTACRSLLYCRACRNPFEAMKPVSSLL